jgi:hypothetical protein
LSSNSRRPRGDEERRPTLIRTVGGLFILVGGVWFLQGIGVLPGSFMTGSTFWAVTGAIVAVTGLVSLSVAQLRKSRREPPAN